MYGNQLKKLRLEHNLNQKELAKESGISHQAISFWESNKRNPNIVYCVILADYYGITLDELVDREIKKNW